MADILYIVVPCYNEEEVLPETSRRLRAKLEGLMAAGKISERSRVLFVNDGSRDRTWELITRLHGECPLFCGADLSRNRGHQNALLIAGALGGSELIGAVAGADGDGQRVAAGLGDELLDLLGTGVAGILGGDIDLVLHAGQGTQLGLDHNTVIVGILNDLLGDLNVLREGLGAGVDHNRGKTAIDAGLAGLEIGAVVQVQRNGNLGALNDGGLHQLHQIGVVGIGTGALGDLKDQRSLLLLGGLSDALDDLHVVDVESADSVSAAVSFLKHLSSGDQWHNYHLLYYFDGSNCTIND